MTLAQYRSSPTPVLAYSLIHQPAAGVPEENYAAAIRDLHGRIGAESASLLSAARRARDELVAHGRQTVHAQLSPFLHTPIETDTREVGRILEEAFGRFAETLTDGTLPDLRASQAGRFFLPPSRKALEKRLIGRGREYLHRLGFRMDRGDAALYESVFVVRGAANLDILEHVVRERIGVYGSVHGRHLEHFGHAAYALHNLIRSDGDIPTPTEPDGLIEASLWFTKPSVEYARFRHDVFDLLDAMVESIKPVHCSLWQRKLGLGGGEEFVLRIAGDRSATVGEMVEWLGDFTRNASVRKSLITDGSLALKEPVF